jgi:tyrosyl-tRNA synthetase
VPQSALKGELTVLQALLSANLATSRRDARELLSKGAISINGTRVAEDRPLVPEDALHGRWVVLRKGPRSQGVLAVSDR